MLTTRPRSLPTTVRAAALAAVLSGAPSTLHALATGRSPLAAVRAAATLVAPAERTAGPAAIGLGLVVHGAISLGWTAVLAAVLPRRHAAAWGAVAGLGIAAFDLGVVGRRYPRITELPVGPQVLDHVAFGAVVGVVLDRHGAGLR